MDSYTVEMISPDYRIILDATIRQILLCKQERTDNIQFNFSMWCASLSAKALKVIQEAHMLTLCASCSGGQLLIS